MAEIKSVIFDFDGILGDTERINYLAAKETFKQYGVELTKQEFMDIWVNRKHTNPGEKASNAFGRIHNLDVDINEVRKKRAEVYKKYYDHGLQLMPGAKEKVLEFYEHFPLAVVSSGYIKQIEYTLKQFEIFDKFKHIVSADDVTKFKPFPEPYLLAMEKMGIGENEGVVIEDTMVGVKSAKAAGLKVIAMPNDFSFQGDFTDADFIADSFNEITLDLLRKL